MALAVLGAAVLLYGWNSLFLSSKSQARSAVQKELTAARRSEQDLRQNLAQLRTLAADTRSREAELARLGRLVPADADVAGAILALNDTAIAAQVAWSSFSPTPQAPNAGGGPAATVGISMKVGGTFHQVFDYLQRLETLDRLVVVDSISLTAGSGVATGSPSIEADLKARMFARGATPTAPGSAGATPPALVKAGS
jgi:Tfp pilus assembly protein PilO